MIDNNINANFAAGLANWMRGAHKGLPDEIASNVKYITVEDIEAKSMTTIFDTLQDEVVAIFPTYTIAVRSNEQKAD